MSTARVDPPLAASTVTLPRAGDARYDEGADLIRESIDGTVGE